MNLDITFEESNQNIDVAFEEVQQASDGGFERGYEEGFEKGNENGYTEGYAEAQEETAPKFGIQNEVKGTNLVTLDYVNENEHNVEVQLSSDTITDFSGYKVKQIGKNLWNKEYARDVNNWVVLGWYPCIPIYVGKGATISVSYQQDLPTGLGLFVAFSIDGTEVGARNKWLYHSSSAGSTSKTRTFIAENDYIYLCSASVNVNYVFLNNFMENIGNDLQIEISNVVTDYESYTEKTYIANANGTVDGIKSASPIMHLMCDGVDISAKYYQRPSAEYDRFWDNYQHNGNRTSYNYAFGGEGWSDETFKPKYDIKVGMSAYMFHSSKITNLKAILEECGVVLDFSNCTTFTYPFNNSTITDIGVIDCRAYATLNYLFYSARCVKNVEKVIVNERNTYSTTGFFDMVALEEIRFEGVIASSFNIQWSSKMSVESAKSILLCLKNYKGTDKDMANTIAFHANVWALLKAEGNSSPNNNSWEDYLIDIGWKKI